MKRRTSLLDDRTPAPAVAIPGAIAKEAANWVARRDAGLTDREEGDYIAWLDADPRHRAAMTRLDFTWKSLDRPLTIGIADAVLCELDHRARRRRRSLAFAVAAFVLLVGAGAGWRLTRSVTPPKSALGATAAVLLPSLQSLPDGSVAELRDGGEISINFTAAERRVELRGGEAYFNVAKNPLRPFVVVAHGVKIRAVGTAFSVQLESASIEVLVTEGTVAVDVAPGSLVPDGTAPPPQPHLIGAGEGATLTVSPDHEKTLVNALPNVDLQSKLAWRSPRLEFSGAQLVEAVALINRHNRLQFVIEDPELAKVRVSGIFGATNTGAFVRLLEASFNVQAERRGDHEIVLRGRR